MESYINTLGDNNQDSVIAMSQIIKNITKIVMEGYQKDCFWLTIRVTQYTSDYDIPRYHCDGTYMGFDYRDDLSKFVTVLQGPGTLFIKTNKQQKEFYICTEKEEQVKSIKQYEKKNNYDSKSDPNFNSKFFTIINDDDIRIRTALDKKLQGERIQANNYQAVIFLAGN